MNIKETWISISISMCDGRVIWASMATAVDVLSEAGLETKWYRRKLSSAEAGIAMRKLEKATGVHATTRYSEVAPGVTEKYSTYCRRR